MSQNIYDSQEFFDGYALLRRSAHGLKGAPEWPVLQSMLPELRGRRVVDLGCGYGWFCRYARENGASHVLGLDVSEKMLARATAMTDGGGIEYRRVDLEMPDLEADTFNLVYSSLTLHYISDLHRLLSAVRAALVPGGSLVFSMEHPIYTAPEHPGWMQDGSGRKSWPVNGYQDQGRRVTDWIAKGVVKHHRTLGTCLNLLLDLGFSLTRVEEWGPTAEQIAEWPELAEERERPMLLLVSARV